MPDDATDILILGAGVSGLAAAARLTQAGCTVRVLEARDRTGGRILTLRGDRWPVPMELGAEFVQGRIPTLFNIAHKMRVPLVELDGGRWLVHRGRLARLKGRLSDMKRIMAQTPELQPEEDRSFDQLLASGGEDESLAEARALAGLWVESYDAAYPDRISVRFLMRERMAEQKIEGDRGFRMVTGYDVVPSALLAQMAPGRGVVQLETIVSEVRWEPGAVVVEARDPHGAARGPFSARRLVVTLPLGVLQSPPTEPGGLRFTPRLLQKEDALGGLDMGHVVKLAMAFKDRFWQRALSHTRPDDELGFLIATEEPLTAWWTGYPVYAPVLVAWAGGPAAVALEGLSTAQRVDRALDSLARLVGESRAAVDRQIVAWDSHDWAADPYARGAYSYVRVGGMTAQVALASPVDKTLFFAGEMTELQGYQATVHGAIFAGERAADEVLRSLGAAPAVNA